MTIPESSETDSPEPAQKTTASFPPRRALSWLVLGIVGAFVLNLANLSASAWILAAIPSLKWPAPGTPLYHLIALAYLAPVLFCLLLAARGAANLRSQGRILLLCGLLLALPMGIQLALAQMKVPSTPALRLTANNLFFPAAAVLIGALIGRIIRHPNTLLAGAGFAAFFDLVVVNFGPVAQLQASNSNLISQVSVGAGAAPTTSPFFATKSIPLLSSVTIGPADVLMAALFLSAIVGLKLAERATVVAMFVLAFLALIAVEIFGISIPAWVPMGVAVLFANAKYAAFTKQEKRDLVIGFVFASACAALIVVGARKLVPKLASKDAGPPRQRAFGVATRPLPQTRELLVIMVDPESVAFASGVHAGDVIEAIDNKLVSRETTYEAALGRLRESLDKGVELRVRRPGAKGPLTFQLPAPRP